MSPTILRVVFESIGFFHEPASILHEKFLIFSLCTKRKKYIRNSNNPAKTIESAKISIY